MYKFRFLLGLVLVYNWTDKHMWLEKNEHKTSNKEHLECTASGNPSECRGRASLITSRSNQPSTEDAEQLELPTVQGHCDVTPTPLSVHLRLVSKALPWSAYSVTASLTITCQTRAKPWFLLPIQEQRKQVPFSLMYSLPRQSCHYQLWERCGGDSVTATSIQKTDQSRGQALCVLHSPPSNLMFLFHVNCSDIFIVYHSASVAGLWRWSPAGTPPLRWHTDAFLGDGFLCSSSWPVYCPLLTHRLLPLGHPHEAQVYISSSFMNKVSNKYVSCIYGYINLHIHKH